MSPTGRRLTCLNCSGAELVLDALLADAEPANASELNASCAELNGTGCGAAPPPARQYWFLLLVLIPLLSVFGNVLVILAVWRERSLQSATNYFIVSLAVADLLVSAAVMPFAVYVQARQRG
ncbi:dopamine D2-like receptor [Pollicipes pollicipes]|uniref:dopamine D2-like receptor n=1 Tax=Pollicipes pollicipes TaxID=41117 RepID=UPI001884E292|nr:dopamine D2-like receptor [Pollicipes pollicipes]